MSIGEKPTKTSDEDTSGGTSAVPPRRPGRPRALPLEEQRRLVVDAGRRVFAREGYNGATIERVAREAGTPRSSVYELFNGKDDLFAAVVADAADRFVTHLLRGFHAAEGMPLREFARRNFATVFELFERDRDAVTVLLNAERGGMEPPMAAVADTRRRVLAEVGRLTSERWADYGIEIGAANEMLSLMYFGLAEGVAVRQANDGDWDREALIDLLTEFTAGGLSRLTRHPEVLHAASRRGGDA
ncbi:MAG TPA: TetR/AcrR family transcriptional regulator [Acidimicrobiales bacterium]|nr:TetR/AcrR family transcriptional regulator [Acidimicrobiales bacterium]